MKGSTPYGLLVQLKILMNSQGKLVQKYFKNVLLLNKYFFITIILIIGPVILQQ